MKGIILVFGILALIAIPKLTIIMLRIAAGVAWGNWSKIYGINLTEKDFIILEAKVLFWSVPIGLCWMGWLGCLLAYWVFLEPNKIPIYIAICLSILFFVFYIGFMKDIKRLDEGPHVRHIIEKLKKGR
jgi:hypothetical protein